MGFLLTPLPDQNKKAITFVIANIPFPRNGILEAAERDYEISKE
jgi:hypothetical protein